MSDLTARILDTLDQAARDYVLPVLDSVNCEFAGGRISAFGDSGDWALIVESIVDAPAGDGLCRDVVAFGSCLRVEPGIQAERRCGRAAQSGPVHAGPRAGYGARPAHAAAR
ncbi:MAG: hypothetical protein R3F62_08695 [Planctomycetota bacterium]